MSEPTSLSVEAGGERSSATFTFYNEDHTIGNTLRYVLNKDPNVTFVGYSVPHPAEPKMNLRLQTSGKPATDVLLDALSTTHDVGAHVLQTFDAAVAEYRSKHPPTADIQ